MPCKCLTGCINKKCSCRAKGVHCTEECAYCLTVEDKYECFNLPGKEPPVTKSKSKPKSKRSTRRNSKISEVSDSENEKALVVPSKELTKKSKNEEKVIHQTVIINNYYSHNEYKQQNNSYTQVINNNYDTNSSNTNVDHGVNNLIKNLSIDDKNETSSKDEKSSSKTIDLTKDDDNDDKKNKNSINNSSIPKLTDSLANDFLKFYWECLSTKSKTKYLERYVSTEAELRIQGIPFIGAKVITERLEDAAPIKINKIEHKIFPFSHASNKFSVTNINNKLLKQSSSSSSSTSIVNYKKNSSNSTKDSNTNNKGLIVTDPNLTAIGKIEANGVMMDCNGNTAKFTQTYHLVYNKPINLVQIKTSILEWK
ncbi:hypothetical protein BCR32DRAFT_268857 [Anaeromyces robustus]|uniref:NTF2 domain-containing protein n=1 Tax=Anaeromyces robustus TaxID=1754192 RepID=A0A1Y1X4C0_9FUNG|nr:hypothetical protein BCR32DRAFT_268857 [Anaeromyces robustus]|eukprot:ORX80488.1 hypothetical protein BCR32DRAFT_268857 [Anaeromyces robustus]